VVVRACRLLEQAASPLQSRSLRCPNIIYYPSTIFCGTFRSDKDFAKLLSAHKDELSSVELEEFAEAYADMVLNPSIPWLRTSMIKALQNPESTNVIIQWMGRSLHTNQDPSWQRDFQDTLEKADRERLIKLIKIQCAKNPPSRAEAHFIMTVDIGGLIRKSLEGAAREFSAKRGAKPKATRRDYLRIATLGDQLYPACLKMVAELRSSKHHSVQYLLEHWEQEFPEACAFLLSHLSHLDATLSDKRLRKRAKRIESFARLVADGMAGADYGLEPRTAIERAREGRRLSARVST